MTDVLDFDTMLDEAEHPFEDVDVCLAGKFQIERDRLIAESKVPDDDERLGQKPKIQRIREELEAIQGEIAKRTVTIRVYQLPGDEWAALRVKFPPTKDSPDLDKKLAMNVEAVSKVALLKHGKRVERVVDGDGKVVEEIEHELDAGQWQKLFAKSSGGDVKALFHTLVGINELTGRAEVERLVKSSRRISGSDKK